MPMLLLGVICLPALIIVVIATVTNDDELPVDYTSYVLNVSLLVMVFLAGQAPASVSRDLRFRVVSLYFSRPLERIDYVLAKYAAMTTALFMLLALPLTILFVGALLAKLPLDEQVPDYLRSLVGALLVALVLAGIGLVIAAITPRRGLGVAAIIAVLAVLAGVQGAVQAIAVEEGADTFAGYTGLFSPFTLVHGVMSSVLGAPEVLQAEPPGALGGAVFVGRHRPGRRGLLRRPAPPLPEGLDLVSTLLLDNVSRWFGNVVAVNDVTMTIGPGVTGLLGPNGAGKSTLIHMMGGFLAPSAGTVTLDGEVVWRNEEIYRQIGLVPEREEMYDVVSGWEFVLANARLHRLADPRGRGPTGDRHRGDDRRAGPRHLDVLQGDEAADQDGDRARARPAGAAARRAVQRDGPAPAAAPDGPAADDGRRRADGPVQLAHPRGGRADRRPHRGDGRRPARRLR